MGKGDKADACKVSYKHLKFSSGNIQLRCLFDPSERDHPLKELWFSAIVILVPEGRQLWTSLITCEIHYLHTKWFYAKYPCSAQFFLIINARVYLLWEQENCYLVSSFFFLPLVNKRDKVMKRKMSIVFFLFHDDCFAEQPKWPTYQLNIINIPYEKEDRKTEIKVGQFPLNVYWCFSVILIFILNIHDKYFSCISECCKCLKYIL